MISSNLSSRRVSHKPAEDLEKKQINASPSEKSAIPTEQSSNKSDKVVNDIVEDTQRLSIQEPAQPEIEKSLTPAVQVSEAPKIDESLATFSPIAVKEATFEKETIVEAPKEQKDEDKNLVEKASKKRSLQEISSSAGPKPEEKVSDENLVPPQPQSKRLKIDPITPPNTTFAEKVVEPEVQKSEPAQITVNEIKNKPSSPPKQVQEQVEEAKPEQKPPSPPKMAEEKVEVKPVEGEEENLLHGPVMKSDENFSKASKL